MLPCNSNLTNFPERNYHVNRVSGTRNTKTAKGNFYAPKKTKVKIIKISRPKRSTKTKTWKTRVLVLATSNTIPQVCDERRLTRAPPAHTHTHTQNPSHAQPGGENKWMRWVQMMDILGTILKMCDGPKPYSSGHKKSQTHQQALMILLLKILKTGQAQVSFSPMSLLCNALWS